MSIWNGVLLWGLSLRELLAGACLLVGFFFIAISAIGVVRLPDFYSRLHGRDLWTFVFRIGLGDLRM